MCYAPGAANILGGTEKYFASFGRNSALMKISLPTPKMESAPDEKILDTPLSDLDSYICSVQHTVITDLVSIQIICLYKKGYHTIRNKGDLDR